VEGAENGGLEGREDMVVTIEDKRVYVRLSRRNLRQLDALLHGQGGRCSCLARRDVNGVCLVIQVEDDADHYEERDPGPALGARSGEGARRSPDAVHS
jgi:hypothetical protein